MRRKRKQSVGWYALLVSALVDALEADDALMVRECIERLCLPRRRRRS